VYCISAIKGKDALVVASAFVNIVQCIVSRELDLMERAVIILGRIEGSEAYNKICKKITIDGTVRSFIKASILRKLKAVDRKFSY